METIKISHNSAVRLALSQYIGHSCTECGHEFDSVEDIHEKDPVCSGKDYFGIKLACRECFDKLRSSSD